MRHAIEGWRLRNSDCTTSNSRTHDDGATSKQPRAMRDGQRDAPTLESDTRAEDRRQNQKSRTYYTRHEDKRDAPRGLATAGQCGQRRQRRQCNIQQYRNGKSRTARAGHATYVSRIDNNAHRPTRQKKILRIGGAWTSSGTDWWVAESSCHQRRTQTYLQVYTGKLTLLVVLP